MGSPLMYRHASDVSDASAGRYAIHTAMRIVWIWYSLGMKDCKVHIILTRSTPHRR